MPWRQDDISDAVQKKLSTEMAAFGFAINKALVTEVSPNAEAGRVLVQRSVEGKAGDLQLFSVDPM